MEPEKRHLRAIQTAYRGYRFRSRLEARWAVFLDSLGVPYEYEPEGFRLGRVHYLPDFWLPEQQLWLEIKPTDPDVDINPDAYLRQCLLADASGFPVATIVGTPSIPVWGEPVNEQDWHYINIPADSPRTLSSMGVPAHVIQKHYGGSDEFWFWDSYDHWWCECPKCGRIGLTYEGRASLLPCNCIPSPQYRTIRDPQDNSYSFDTARIVAACTAARSARFEHGESPEVPRR